MTTLQAVLLAVAVCIIFMMFLAVCGIAVWFYLKKQREEAAVKKSQIDSTREFSEAVKKLTEASAQFADFPKLLTGQVKTSAAMVGEITKLRTTVVAFQQLINGPSRNNPTLTVPSEQESDAAFRIKDLMMDNPGMDYQVARLQVEEEMESGMGME